MFVCLSAFYRPHDICPLCGAASESESRSRRGRPRASGQACTARARARMPYNFSTKKSYADAFQKQNRTRAHAVVYVTAEIFKKGKKKTNMPLPKFSLSLVGADLGQLVSYICQRRTSLKMLRSVVLYPVETRLRSNRSLGYNCNGVSGVNISTLTSNCSNNQTS